MCVGMRRVVAICSFIPQALFIVWCFDLHTNILKTNLIEYIKFSNAAYWTRKLSSSFNDDSQQELLSFLIQYAAFENLMYSIKLVSEMLVCKSEHHTMKKAWGINEHIATTLLIPTHMICDVLFDWMTTISLYPL